MRSRPILLHVCRSLPDGALGGARRRWLGARRADQRDGVLTVGGPRHGSHPALRTARVRTRLRDTVEGGDLPWRFFFATRLVLEPTPSDIASEGLLPTVRATARREFVADLEERGFSAVDRERTRRIRTEAGERVRFARLVARFETGEVAATVHAWFGVWNHEGEFRIAGGTYPVRGFSGIDLAPAAYRTELFGLLRCVA